MQSAVTKEWITPRDKEYKLARILFRPYIERITWKLIATFNHIFPTFIFKQMFSSFSNLPYSTAKDSIIKDDISAIKRMNNRQRSGYGFFIDMVQVNDLEGNDLQKVSCPTLILHSKHDQSVSLDHPYFAHDNIPASQLCLLDSWGHLIWLGKSAKQVDEYLFTFLNTEKISYEVK